MNEDNSPEAAAIVFPERKRFQDISGLVFGKLKVISYKGKRMYECQCDCGNYVTIRSDHIIRSHTLSCGCLNAPDDLTGKIFGDLKVLSKAIHRDGSRAWQCECACGNINIYRPHNLISGSTKSCGCAFRGEDLAGKIFGSLTAKYLVISKSKLTSWMCTCECGKDKIVLAGNLKSGKTKSCGDSMHWNLNKMKENSTTHGLSRSAIYNIYYGIIARCHNQNHIAYKKYGAIGISVCSEWRESFERFFSDMGPRPSPYHSVDRINPFKGYNKDNCRWSTAIEQGRNKRKNRLLTMNGKTKCLAEWCEITGLSRECITSRINLGWTEQRALSTPSLRVRKSKNSISLSLQTLGEESY